ncbi:cytochrome c [Azospirillum sp.]|uniref:c-type cytochrome n=1 Tax=Azospirillum sp. TaxID=34012 RepID=UPI002D5B534B|nr:cytochrome c [Azospirillum sp.]HYD71463.1 cytochrome c [Azospirillum sp.]
MIHRVAAAALPAAAGLLLLALPAHAQGDPKAGQAKAMMCQTCHGRQGITTAPGVPNLAGQNEAYVVAQLKAFRDGTRRHEQMTVVAKSLNDDDIRNLAAFYGQIKVTVAE